GTSSGWFRDVPYESRVDVDHRRATPRRTESPSANGRALRCCSAVLPGLRDELLLDAVEEALLLVVLLRAGGRAQRLAELLQQGALLLGEGGGRHHEDAHVLVAATAPAQVRDALAAQDEHLVALRARRDGERRLAVHRRHLYLGAERGLDEVDRQLVEDVVLV